MASKPMNVTSRHRPLQTDGVGQDVTRQSSLYMSIGWPESSDQDLPRLPANQRGGLPHREGVPAGLHVNASSNMRVSKKGFQ